MNRPDDRDAGRPARHSWLALMVAGLGMSALGIVVLAWPKETLAVLAILVGAALIVSGGLRLFEAFGPRSEDAAGRRFGSGVIGLLAVIVGVYCLADQAVTVLVLALLVGVLWIVHGITDLAVARSTPTGTPGRGLRALAGAFSIVVGVIMVAWSGMSLVVLLTLLGAWLLCYGVLLTVLAFRLRSSPRPYSHRESAAATPA